ncbi:MAG: hypothetical protein AABY22_15510 [Nanoarchaeota archaeon]
MEKLLKELLKIVLIITFPVWIIPMMLYEAISQAVSEIFDNRI